MSKTDEGDGGLGAGVWVALGLSAGALLGLTLAWRTFQSRHAEIVESVEDLRERAHRVLNELSANVTDLVDQTRPLPSIAGEPSHSVVELTISEMHKESGFEPDHEQPHAG